MEIFEFKLKMRFMIKEICFIKKVKDIIIILIMNRRNIFMRFRIEKIWEFGFYKYVDVLLLRVLYM